MKNTRPFGRLVAAAAIVFAMSASRLPAQAPPAGPVTPSLPASLDRTIGQVQVFIGRDLDASFATLAQEGRVPMGIEMLPNRPTATDPDPRVVVRRSAPPPPLVLGPGALSEALSQLLEHQPAYTMSIADGVISIMPAQFANRPGHFLDQPIDRFVADDVSVRMAVKLLRHTLNPAFVVTPDPPPNSTGFRGPFNGSPADLSRVTQEADVLFSRHVTLIAERATPRQILNRLVAQHGELFWTATYRGWTVSEAADPIETNCAITLNTFVGNGIRQQFDPVRTSPPPPLPAGRGPATPALPGRGGGRVLVTRPTDADTLLGAVLVLARSTHALVGIETIQEPRTRPDPSAPLYDLSGLTMPAALDNLLASMPDYVWHSDGGIYHVQPKNLAADPTVPLNRHLDSFNHELPSPFEALKLVHSALDGRPFGPSPAVGPPTFPPFSDKPLTMTLSNVTGRDVLDSVHGADGFSSTAMRSTPQTARYPSTSARRNCSFMVSFRSPTNRY